MATRLTFTGKRFVLSDAYAIRDIVKNAGFRWDGYETKTWSTSDAHNAKQFAGYADKAAADEINRLLTGAETAVEASRAADLTGDTDIPVPDGLEYLPFQKAGIVEGAARVNVLIGDEMGLGKTIQAIGIMNMAGSNGRTLVVCPATPKINWQREMEKWLTDTYTIAVGDAQNLPDTDIVIINYDVLDRHCTCVKRTKELKAIVKANPNNALAAAELRTLTDAMKKRLVTRDDCPLHGPTWGTYIVDECHYIKNDKTVRSRQIRAVKTNRAIFMTGTPICNRPIELWPTISYLDPDHWNSKTFWGYAKRFCDAKNNGYGWDMRGAANLDELQRILRGTILIRRLKKDVLTELPAKFRQVIEIPANGNAEIVAHEVKAMAAQEQRLAELKAAVELAKCHDDPEEYHAAVEALRDGVTAAFTEISQLRHDTAVAKIPDVITHVREVLDAEDKVVVFAHHKDVVKALAEEFGDAAVKITGDVPPAQRMAIVDRFQTDPTITVFIGNIQAAGTAITLTAASHVIFAELDWVPGNISQAEDRCHRIGQNDNVLVQHLVLEGSIDATLAKTIVAKQKVIDAALDKETELEPVVPMFTGAATEGLTRKIIEREAPTLTADQVDAIQTALRTLAGTDADFARIKNDVGFNQVDAAFGHSLAEQGRLTNKQAVAAKRMVLKYHRQIGDDLVARIKAAPVVQST
jgi:SWI/SNF-related matrix-associated actin-dependent regulator 1 of chromatin subfamily A